MQYPEGFEHIKSSEKSNKKDSLKNGDDSDDRPPEKKLKIEPYKLESDVSDLVKKDIENSKLWKECKSYLTDGKISFLNQVSKA